MARIFSLPEVRALLFDLDGTLYRCPEYILAGQKGEIANLASFLRVSFADAELWLDTAQKGLCCETGQHAGRGQTVLANGFTDGWWNRIRNECYQPEKFLRPWPGLEERLRTLVKYYQIAVVSNSPTDLVRRVLSVIGLNSLMGRFLILGGNDAPPKPSPEVFAKAANRLQVPVAQCLSIGDRPEYDAWPAMRTGMGAVVVDGMEDLVGFLDGLIEGLGQPTPQRPFDLARLLRKWYQNGEVNITGITGQAGGGKTTMTYLLHELAVEMNVPLHILPLDCFFRLSSQQRKHWLEEGKQSSAEEYARRADQMSWWDFDRLEESLNSLRSGQDLYLEGVYNRADKGELTLNLHIPVHPRQGALVVLEGVAIAHKKDHFSHLLYLHAPREVRRRRLEKRDPHRVGPEAAKRFRLTESFEIEYFREYLQNGDLFVDNGKPVPVLMDQPPALGEL